MPAIAIPDSIRPYAAALAKHHFWLLALVAPLLLVPLLFVGGRGIEGRIAAQRSEIDSRLSALQAVRGIAEHPNEAWAKSVEEQTAKYRAETLAEWQRLWDEQRPLRVWPPKLGPDFAAAVAALKTGASLDKKLLLRYRDTIQAIVEELPGRMGADQFMVDAGADASSPVARRPGPGMGPGFPGGERPGFGPRPGPGGMPAITRPGQEGAESDALVVWSADDQARLYQSFSWEDVPSTAQVLLAQEELWVYGVFCDLIKRANSAATGSFSAPISMVEQLAVGYPAAEDRPGGEGSGRIYRQVPVGVGAAEGVGEMMAMQTEGAAGGGRPVHPRFSSTRFGGGPEMGLPGGDPAAAAGSPDDQLREWIYVDFNGKPLSAAELAAAPFAKMVVLMPFVLRVVMDQRRLDPLLVDIAQAPLPIDVRQVRINEDAVTNTAGGVGAGPAGPPAGLGRGMSDGPGSRMPGMPVGGSPALDGARPYDVTVELRGSVAIAPQPDPAALGVVPPTEGGGP